MDACMLITIGTIVQGVAAFAGLALTLGGRERLGIALGALAWALAVFPAAYIVQMSFSSMSCEAALESAKRGTAFFIFVFAMLLPLAFAK